MTARKKPGTRKKPGRPSIRSDELAQKIIDAYLDPGERRVSLVRLCDEREDLPTATFVWEWMAQEPAFAAKITRAKEVLSERELGQTYEDLAGLKLKPEDPIANARVTLAAKTADQAVKLAGQYAPRVYGAKLKLDESGTNEPLAQQLDAAERRIKKENAKVQIGRAHV